MEKKPYNTTQILLAWSVHAFTALGAVAGFFAIVFISRHQFEAAWVCLITALVIDGVDGTFARLFKVKEVLPSMDGKNIDFVVDFANYAIIPAWFIFEASRGGVPLLDEGYSWVAVSLILLSSALYYGREGMVSDDQYFMGFPVMWNLVGFYLYYIFFWPAWVNFAVILFLCMAQFFPIKFLYPSRTQKFQALHIVATVLIIGSNVALLFLLGNQPWADVLRIVSIVSLAYFLVMSLYATFFLKTD